MALIAEFSKTKCYFALENNIYISWHTGDAWYITYLSNAQISIYKVTLFGVFWLLPKFVSARFRVFPFFSIFSKKSENQCQNILLVRRYYILLYLETHLDKYKPHVKYSIFDPEPFLSINCINCINLIKDSKTLKKKLCQFHLPYPPQERIFSWFCWLLQDILALIAEFCNT